jgi:hypothetical protein
MQFREHCATSAKTMFSHGITQIATNYTSYDADFRRQQNGSIFTEKG